MQKTKLGISVGLLGAAICFSGLFGGYLVTTILAGYVLLFEENVWLKKTGIKVIALMFSFSLLGAIIGLLPNGIGIIDSVFNIFGGTFSINFITRIVALTNDVLNFIQIVVFVLLGIKAFSQGTLRIPVVDNIINKYFD